MLDKEEVTGVDEDATGDAGRDGGGLLVQLGAKTRDVGKALADMVGSGATMLEGIHDDSPVLSGVAIVRVIGLGVTVVGLARVAVKVPCVIGWALRMS